MAIEFKPEVEDKLIASIRRYLDEELDLELGDLKAKLLLRFTAQEIGPSIYNRAVRDAQVYFQDRITDLEGTCFEPEKSYWEL